MKPNVFFHNVTIKAHAPTCICHLSLSSLLFFLYTKIHFLQKAHVQQFLATEDALNKAAEARNTSQLLLKRLHGSGDAVSSNSLIPAGSSQNMSSLRQLEVISLLNLISIILWELKQKMLL